MCLKEQEKKQKKIIHVLRFAIIITSYRIQKVDVCTEVDNVTT